MLIGSQAEDRFVSEELRAIHYLSNQTAAPLQRILESALLTPHLQAIIGNRNSGLDVMIDTDKKTDLARLYKLFIKVPAGLPCLRRAIKDTIATRGKEINSLGAVSGPGGADGGEGEDAPEPSGKGKGKAVPPGSQLLQVALKWVEDVLALKDKFDTIWSDSFASDRDLESGINEVCYTFSIDATLYSPAGISRPSSRSSTTTRGPRNTSRFSSTKTSRRVSRA